MTHRRWQDLSTARRRTIVAASVVQITLAGGAWWDLSRRPAAAVRGPKPAWALIIAINFVGPLLYLRFGRKPVLMDPEEFWRGN
ncbi:PLD nuclease N-terminal domain-containing protein [Amycolatopsis pigmentata]|uniref:PLD nuclease N-terminal domain-containing protein n=1 Tax=Amycolatopsis pigmentata TaxID=450801 RepID=A0ABW5FWM0_9PSEU